jgi:hypothetical protein
VRYVHKLSAQHLKSKNYVEAGLSLLLHSELLEWRDDRILESQLSFPRQTEVLAVEEFNISLRGL